MARSGRRGVAWLSSDDTVRCVVISGAGGKAFSPGDDIGEFSVERATPERAKAHTATMHHAVEAVRDCRHPVIAQIEGVCVGGGLALAAACDIRICGESSRFGVPHQEAGRGSPPRRAGNAVATGRVRRKLLEILLEGEVLDARKAMAMGLVNHVVPDGER